MDLLPGVRSHTVATSRLRTRYLDSGPDDGIPVVLIHGNLATCRFYEPLMAAAPGQYRCIAPDMRGFGDTERPRLTPPAACAIGRTTPMRCCRR